MENMKQRVSTMSRRRPYVLVGIFVVLGLLVVDILFHVTLLTKVGRHTHTAYACIQELGSFMTIDLCITY